MVHPLGSTVLSTGPGLGRVRVAITVATPTGVQPLVVELADDPDPADALGGLEAVAGTTNLVVERSGTPFRGAVVGRDLLPGDHLVAPDQRRRPRLCALTGPLRPASVVADRELVIGRGGRFGDRTVDDGEVSRDHLRISPTPSGVRATDQGSTNGTLRNGEPLDHPVTLRSGDRLEVGGSTLVLLGDPPRGAHLRSRDGAVEIAVNDRPPPPNPAAVDATEATGDEQAARGRWFGRRRHRPEPVLDADEQAAAEQAAATAGWARAEAERAWRRDLHPDPAVAAALAAGWSPDLWGRFPGHPAHLTVRVGSAAADGSDPVGYAALGRPTATTGSSPVAAHEPGAPCVLDLRTERSVAVVGPPERTAAHAAAWLLHLAATERPTHVELGVRTAPGSVAFADLVAAAWWLPHRRIDLAGTSGAARLGEEAAGPAPHPAGPAWPVTVVEVPDDLAAAQVLAPLAERPVGTVVWLTADLDAVPAPTTSVIDTTAGGHAATWRRAPSASVGDRRPEPLPFDLDLVSVTDLDDLARLLAPLVATPAVDSHAG